MKILQILVLLLMVLFSLPSIIGQSKTINLVLLNGTVKFVGKPVSAAFIQLTDHNGVKYLTKTNEKGKYKLEIPAGKYQIFAGKSDNNNGFVGTGAEFIKTDFLITKKRKIKFDFSLYLAEEG